MNSMIQIFFLIIVGTICLWWITNRRRSEEKSNREIEINIGDMLIENDTSPYIVEDSPSTLLLLEILQYDYILHDLLTGDTVKINKPYIHKYYHKK